MADIKKKGSIDKPKVKTSGFVPKEAASIIKEKYQEQQERNAPGKKDPVRYATDKVESGGKRAARTAGDALKQKAKKEFIKQRQQKKAQKKNPEQPQQNTPPIPPSEQNPATETTPPTNAQGGSGGQFSQNVAQHTSLSDPGLDPHGAGLNGQEDMVSPSRYYGNNLSTESTHSSTINSARERSQTPDQGGATSQGRNAIQERQKTQGKQKAKKDARKAKERQAQQQRFNTRDQSYLAESGQQKSSLGSNHSTAHIGKDEVNSATKPLQSGSQTLQGRRSSTVLNAPSAKEGNSGFWERNPVGKPHGLSKQKGIDLNWGHCFRKEKIPLEAERLSKSRYHLRNGPKHLPKRKPSKLWSKRRRTKQK